MDLKNEFNIILKKYKEGALEKEKCEEITNGHSGATIYKIELEKRKYFAKILPEKLETQKIERIKQALEIYRKLKIQTLELIDYGNFETTNQTYLIYSFIEGKNLKEYGKEKKLDLVQIQEIGRKIGSELLKLKQWKEYPKNVFPKIELEESVENLITRLQQSHIELPYFEKFEIEKLEEELFSKLDLFKSMAPNLIHGDIKRSNIMVNREGKYFLVDCENMELSYDIMNFRYQITWVLFQDHLEESAFVKGIWDGIYANKRPKHFKEMIRFMVIFNFLEESISRYQRNQEREEYAKKCKELLKNLKV